MRSCDYCGKENHDEAQNCEGCGCSLVKPNSQSDGDIIGFRAIVLLLGIGLLICFVLGGWRGGLKAWLSFGALTGLFIGYGIGGDIWGARLFDLFTGQNSQRGVEKEIEARKKKDKDHVA